MVKRITAPVLAALMLLALGTIAPAGDLTPNGQRYDSVNIGINSREANSRPGEIHADVMLGSLTAQRAFRSALPSIHAYSQTAHVQASAGIESDSALASAGVRGKNWVMWDTPWLTHETNRGKDGYYGYKNVSSGFATGMGRLVGDSSVVGLAVGYDARKLTNRGPHSWDARTDALHTALYAGTAIGCFFVDAYAGFSRSWHRSSRYVIGNSIRPARNGANYDDNTYSAGVKVSYSLVLPGGFRLTPTAGLDYSHVRMGPFTEFSRNIAGQTDYDGIERIGKGSNHFVQVPLTLALNKTYSAEFLRFKGACSLWTPEIRAGWTPHFGDKRAAVTNIHDDGRKSVAKSAALGDSRGFVGAGLKIQLADRLILAVDYNYAFGDRYSNHTVTGTYGVSF